MKKIIGGLIIILLLILIGLRLNTWLKIDTCLDSGGSWDYKAESCKLG